MARAHAANVSPAMLTIGLVVAGLLVVLFLYIGIMASLERRHFTEEERLRYEQIRLEEQKVRELRKLNAAYREKARREDRERRDAQLFRNDPKYRQKPSGKKSHEDEDDLYDVREWM